MTDVNEMQSQLELNELFEQRNEDGRLNSFESKENVSPIVSTKKRNSNKSNENFISDAEEQRHVIDYISHNPSPISYSVKKMNRYISARPNISEHPVIYRVNEENRTVDKIDEEFIAGDLFNYLCSSPYGLVYQKCREVVKAWHYSRSIVAPVPPSLVQLSDTRLGFTRFPFDLNINATTFDCPNWYKILNRMSNSEAFCARIGSLFDPDRLNNKQIVWLMGETGAGKSLIIKAIRNFVSKKSIGVITYELLQTAHWAESLIGKSVVFAHEAPAALMRSPKFKSLTGDEDHIINPKGKSIYTSVIKPIFFFTSNEDTEVQNDQAIIDRIIHCYLQLMDKDDKLDEIDVLNLLDKESEQFANLCYYQYKRICKAGIIECDRSAVMEAVEEFESEYDTVFERYFSFEDGCKVLKVRDYNEIMEHEFGKDGHKKRDFKKFVKNKYKCDFRSQARFGDKPIKVVSNIKLRYKRNITDIVTGYME